MIPQKIPPSRSGSISYGSLRSTAAPQTAKVGHLGNKEITMKFAKAAFLFTLTSVAVWAQFNAGEQKPEASLPFNMNTVATFELPWRLAFLPDGRMLVTEKIGPLWLVTQQGEKTMVNGTPAVYW